MEFRYERVDIQRVAYKKVRDIDLRGLAASKRLKLDQDLDESVRDVTIDIARVKQILFNYLSNGIKFTHEGGHVVIRVRGEGADHFRIDVEDDGIGIAPEDIEKLFIEFHQLDASSAKKYQGTGLGLALVKRIAELHGGRVDVRSELQAEATFSCRASARSHRRS